MMRNLILLLALSFIALAVPANPPSKKKAPVRKSTAAVARKPAARAPTTAKGKAATTKRGASRASRFSPWKEPTFADSTIGDIVDGEDLVVRRAAVDALGPYNGTVVVADPYTGRVLSIVNQKLAYKSGFQPCSTFKVLVGLAALSEGVIERDTPLRLYGRTSMTLTDAIAKSNNPFFESLGRKLGFEKVHYYARLFGLGERATLGNDSERPGTLPAEPPKYGGVGMMCSFGEGILLTPLQYAGALSAIANGGTLYYLQHAQTREEAESFMPRVKRHLDIEPWIPEIKPGMTGTVEYGTGKRAAYDSNEPILGKTGTCTDRQSPTHLGWFGSFNDVERNKLVVVVLLTGGRPVNGPVAAGVAGQVYKNLSDQRYFAQERRTSPVALVSPQTCCLQ
jgi:penicillin-binding protein 2